MEKKVKLHICIPRLGSTPPGRNGYKYENMDPGHLQMLQALISHIYPFWVLLKKKEIKIEIL